MEFLPSLPHAVRVIQMKLPNLCENGADLMQRLHVPISSWYIYQISENEAVPFVKQSYCMIKLYPPSIVRAHLF